MSVRVGVTVFTGIVFLLFPLSAFAAFDTNLQSGWRGVSIVELQLFLISRGLLPAGNATGYFGTMTRNAVQSFQRQQGVIPASGFFGPLTRAKANFLSATSTSQVSENLPVGLDTIKGPWTLGGWYFTDGLSVYYNPSRTPTGYIKLPGAHPATFKNFGSQYGGDNTVIYYKGTPLSGADASTFTVIIRPCSVPGGVLGRDKNYIYQEGKILPNINPATTTGILYTRPMFFEC